MDHVAAASEYEKALENAGFRIVAQRNRRAFALDFFNRLRARTAGDGKPPPLGLHLLMRPATKTKLENLIESLVRGVIAPVEFIAQR